MSSLGELVDAVWEIGGDELGIDAQALDKLERAHGRLRQPAALNAATRMRTHLLNLDRDFAPYAQTDPADPPAPEQEFDPTDAVETSDTPTATVVRAVAWRSVPDRHNVRSAIASVSSQLDDICEQVQRANLPDGEQALTRIERAQLIAILQTAIAILQAPMVERGLLARAGKSLGDAAAKTAEREVQQGLGAMMGIARKELFELLRSIFLG